MRPLLEIAGLSKRFGGVLATDGLSLDVRSHEIHALIGPNGAGKTTALSQIAGELSSDAGRIFLDGRDLTDLDAVRRVRAGIVRTFQVPRLLADETALENVAIAVQAAQKRNYALFDKARTDRTRIDPALQILEKIGMEDRAAVVAADLSHGEHKLLELGIALALNPRVLLLDEPMAGLGANESARLAPFLKTLREQFAILIVEHDMDVVFSLADRITVLVYGRAIVTGSADEVRNHPEVIAAYLGHGDEAAFAGSVTRK